jgi:hypothetical protein
LTLDEVATRLYALPPEEFTAARDECVRTARGAGDRELAKRIGALRRPTVGAWLVNLLAHRRPDLIAALMALATDLRAAQRNLRGDDLRELSVRRRELVTALTRESRALAVEAGRGVRDTLPFPEVEATLTAALADADVAEQVRLGRLVKPIEYHGFGELPRPQLRLVQGGAEGTPDPADAADDADDPDADDPDANDPDADGAGDEPAPPVARSGRARGGLVVVEPGGAPRRTAPAPAPAQAGGHGTAAAKGGDGYGTTAAKDAGGHAAAKGAGGREAALAEREAALAAREAALAEWEAAQRTAAQTAAQAAEERETAERQQATERRRAAKEKEAAERAEERRRAAAQRRQQQAAHRELLTARTALAEAEAARATAEQAVRLAKRRVEAALAAVIAIDPDG